MIEFTEAKQEKKGCIWVGSCPLDIVMNFEYGYWQSAGESERIAIGALWIRGFIENKKLR